MMIIDLQRKLDLNYFQAKFLEDEIKNHYKKIDKELCAIQASLLMHQLPVFGDQLPKRITRKNVIKEHEKHNKVLIDLSKRIGAVRKAVSGDGLDRINKQAP